jgi:hypothetical protein
MNSDIGIWIALRQTDGEPIAHQKLLLKEPRHEKESDHAFQLLRPAACRHQLRRQARHAQKKDAPKADAKKPAEKKPKCAEGQTYSKKEKKCVAKAANAAQPATPATPAKK